MNTAMKQKLLLGALGVVVVGTLSVWTVRSRTAVSDKPAPRAERRMREAPLQATEDTRRGRAERPTARAEKQRPRAKLVEDRKGPKHLRDKRSTKPKKKRYVPQA